MDKRYLAKIIATDNEGLQMISTCCAGAKVKISDIKFLQSNKMKMSSLKSLLNSKGINIETFYSYLIIVFLLSNKLTNNFFLCQFYPQTSLFYFVVEFDNY